MVRKRLRAKNTWYEKDYGLKIPATKKITGKIEYCACIHAKIRNMKCDKFIPKTY